ncbi:hypothetical protein HanLR1_Chr13g0486611 [Helianthus annuus]|nr:hypothetical protein HanHA89_Chr13g0516721 [Helianthus annuus]KAJ0663944.1 hypothetical protein HanLR1_Chr13g0486611 [Helianthus annuus]
MRLMPVMISELMVTINYHNKNLKDFGIVECYGSGPLPSNIGSPSLLVYIIFADDETQNPSEPSSLLDGIS